MHVSQRILWMPVESQHKNNNPCCPSMEHQLTYTCSQHSGDSCPDVLIRQGKFGYTLFSPNAEYLCSYCPFCGTKLEVCEEDEEVDDASL